LKYFKVAGMTPDQIARLDHLPHGHGLLGAIARERENIRLEKMQDDARSEGFCPAHPRMTSLLGVPIQVGQQLFGILYLCDRIDGQPFSEQDEWLIETVAGYAALAIVGSQLREQQNRLTLLEERDRISMELHDGVIQSLYAMGMNLDILRMNGSASSDELRASVENVNHVIDDIRRYIMDLRRIDQQKKTIYECLDDILKHLHQSENVELHLDAPREMPLLGPAAFDAICQMANEAISNALRHSEASLINVLAVQSANVFQITIADNGKGFDLKALESNTGLGLHNIQQRAALNGGLVKIEAAPGNGTRLIISFPIRPS
jgi:signal transduction histidine kinase